MQKVFLSLFIVTFLFGGCATWKGAKKDSSKAWHVTKKTSKKAWESTKEVIHNATLDKE